MTDYLPWLRLSGFASHAFAQEMGTCHSLCGEQQPPPQLSADLLLLCWVCFDQCERRIHKGSRWNGEVFPDRCGFINSSLLVWTTPIPDACFWQKKRLNVSVQNQNIAVKTNLHCFLGSPLPKRSSWSKQWAAVITHSLSINAAPQNCSKSCPIMYPRATTHGQPPSRLSSPPTIRISSCKKKQLGETSAAIFWVWPLVSHLIPRWQRKRCFSRDRMLSSALSSWLF